MVREISKKSQLGKKTRRNRASREYKQRKAVWLEERRRWGDWFMCALCPNETQEPELDHIQRVGSHPELLMDETNWQLLCRECHDKKDGGMRTIDKHKRGA